MSLLAAATSALALGALGSLHCAGMCGPLAVAGCSRSGAPTGTLNGTFDRLANGTFGYFAGRLAAYATIGALVGHLGKHALCVLPVSAANAAAVALTALPAAARGVALLRPAPPSYVVPLRRKPRRPLLASIAKVLPRRGLALGLATGVLPCGLLLGALAMAAATGSAALGAASMAAFAVGSAPGLLLALVGRSLAARLRLRVPRWALGLCWCALAVWLGVRLALGQGGCHVPVSG